MINDWHMVLIGTFAVVAVLAVFVLAAGPSELMDLLELMGLS